MRSGLGDAGLRAMNSLSNNRAGSGGNINTHANSANIGQDS